MQSVLKRNVRSFWLRKSKDRPIEHVASSSCGEPSPPPMDLICKGKCPSKCLDFVKAEKKPTGGLFRCLKKQPETPREKPSNCKREEKPSSEEERFSWRETMFGQRSKKPWPDPCTCRLAHRDRKKMRTRDPRLRDPRYQQTEGDVLLYTELTRRRSTSSCLEPQPKPPPAYKMPKAAFFKLMADTSYVTLLNHPAFAQTLRDIEKSMRLEPRSLPYEELRPPEKQRKSFSCQLGIQSENVPPPINRDLHYHGGLRRQSVGEPNLPNKFEPSQTNQKELADTRSSPDRSIRKRSRIEQLKILVGQKDVSPVVTGSFDTD